MLITLKMNSIEISNLFCFFKDLLKIFFYCTICFNIKTNLLLKNKLKINKGEDLIFDNTK